MHTARARDGCDLLSYAYASYKQTRREWCNAGVYSRINQTSYAVYTMLVHFKTIFLGSKTQTRWYRIVLIVGTVFAHAAVA